MAKPRPHLNRAPIREAVVDIAIEPRVDLDAIVATAASELGATFDRRSDIWEATFGLQFDGKGPVPPKGGPSRIGVRFDSRTPPHVLQYRTNGFTFSRLTPYEDWRQVRDAAKPHWTKYADSVRACKVKRLAVRYINELNLPLPSSDFAEFLTAAPQVPRELPQSVTAFLQRVVIATDTYSAVVTQSLESVVLEEQRFVVLLDIDVSRGVLLEPKDPGVWQILDDLRDVKNQIFFSHLTEKGVDVFA